MNETEITLAKTMEQVADQYRVVVHLARALALVHEQSIKAYANLTPGSTMIDILGFRSARIMETLGNILNEMDAVEDNEDAWTRPIFEIAQATWPTIDEG